MDYDYDYVDKRAKGTGSTEVFHHGQSRWREITGLPCASRVGPRGATLRNTVYMFVCQAQILRLDTAVEEWINVGEMVGERSDHAVSVVSVDNYCSSISSSSSCSNYIIDPIILALVLITLKL